MDGSNRSQTYEFVYNQDKTLPAAEEGQSFAPSSLTSETKTYSSRSGNSDSSCLPSIAPGGAPKGTQGGDASVGKKRTKQAKKPRRRWKRPKDKPKRPLSAYNLYFKAERERIVAGHVSDCPRNLNFREMAKFIATKWNSLGPEDRASYEKRAEAGKKDYFIAIAKWKRVKKEEDSKRQRGEKEDNEVRKVHKESLTRKVHKQAASPNRTTSLSSAFNYESIFSTNQAPRGSHSESDYLALHKLATNTSHQSHDNLEPIPIGEETDESTKLDASSRFLNDGNLWMDGMCNSSPHSTVQTVLNQHGQQHLLSNLGARPTVHDKGSNLENRDDSAIVNTLQSVLGCFDEDLSQDKSELQVCDDNLDTSHPIVRRVFSTFDALRADNDFVDFMTTMNWR